MTQLITALVSIHSSMTFLADMYGFLDSPSKTVLFSVDDRSLFPVDCMIGLTRVIFAYDQLFDATADRCIKTRKN